LSGVAGGEAGILSHVLMAGGVVMSFMMKRTAKVSDLFVSALAESSATPDKQYFELRGMNAPSDASALLLEQSLEEFCVRNPLPKSSNDSGSFRLSPRPVALLRC